MTDTESYEDKIERLAKKIFHGGDGNEPAAPDMETARRVARRILEDSEERTQEAINPYEADVIRRSSSETAATGETTTPRVSDGE